MDDDVSKFWDDVHRQQYLPSLGDTKFEDYGKYFGRVGPFEDDLRAAHGVLDVGPGIGNFIRGLPGEIRKYAIDVSAINRERIAPFCTDVAATGTIKIIGKADLITCLSVTQHCDDKAVDKILRDVYFAMTGRGVFYVNGIVDKHPNARLSDVDRLHAGRFSRTSESFTQMAREHNLIAANILDYEIPPPCPVNAWIMRMVFK